MIQVDNRAGSQDMAPLLVRLGMEVELCQMPFGDVAWMGWGANGEPVSVGIEMKTVDDCVACIQSGRFAGHQLPGLIKSYDHIYLMVQGTWRARFKDGIMEQLCQGRSGGVFWRESGGGMRRFMWNDFESWLTTMEVMGGIRILRVSTWQEGAAMIKSKYNWFQKTEHKSHQVVYSSKEIYADQALLMKPTLARRVAKELPQIGLKRSADVARVFPTLEAMVNADVKDWTMVEGVGMGIAKKVYDAIHGKNGNGKH